MRAPPKPPRRPPLPVRPGAKASVATKGAVRRPQPAAGPYILVVDDDPEILTLLLRSLEQEYAVVTARDGPTAVELAGTEPYPQLIVLDVMMPGMDGFEVARKIRKLPHGKRIPIVFLTARDAPMDMIRGIQAGARSYLTKPFKLDELMAKIRSTLAR